jgi:archaellum component FlaG (FlaF/FlaG flagellin family)
MAESDKTTGSVKVHVDPKQAYVFVDGNAIRDGSQKIA